MGERISTMAECLYHVAKITEALAGGSGEKGWIPGKLPAIIENCYRKLAELLEETERIGR